MKLSQFNCHLFRMLTSINMI